MTSKSCTLNVCVAAIYEFANRLSGAGPATSEPKRGQTGGASDPGGSTPRRICAGR